MDPKFQWRFSATYIPIPCQFSAIKPQKVSITTVTSFDMLSPLPLLSLVSAFSGCALAALFTDPKQLPTTPYDFVVIGGEYRFCNHISGSDGRFSWDWWICNIR